MSRTTTTAPHHRHSLEDLSTTTRRDFLVRSGVTAAGLVAHPLLAQDAATRRPKVAAIFTVLRFRSHAYNILENFLGPYLFNGQLTDPGVDVVSFYADQFPDDDMAREVSRRFRIPLYKNIDQALCLGGDELAVDAVLSIGEHGDYGFNELGQHMYPRKEFFDQSLAVMHRCGRYVPYFNDKHLSYRWDWSREMYDVARENRFPLGAGSSVPLAQRVPPLRLPANAKIEEAVSIHGGGLESYDFHGLEVLQSIVESRGGGETGISRVELFAGKKYKQALDDGRWSAELVEQAMSAEQKSHRKRQPWPRKGVIQSRKESIHQRPPGPGGPYAIVLTYKDGLKATVLRIGSSSDRWNFACRVAGESSPRATAFFNSPWGNRGLFKALSHAIQHMFVKLQEPYPVERTLLTTGVTEAVMQSNQSDGPIDTPHLEIGYQPTDWRAMRELGDTWKTITASTPQPTDFAPRPFAELTDR